MATKFHRRSFISGALATSGGASLCGAFARVLPSNMAPKLSPDFHPVDSDERGLWSEVDDLEAEIKQSKRLIKEARLNTYISDLVCRLGGAYCSNSRIYILNIPEFNASMAPNGMMIINSGLLLRMRNEAQLATVLAHEMGHYLRRHSLDYFRNLKKKTAAINFIGVGMTVAAGAVANGIGNADATRAVLDSRDQLMNMLALSIPAYGRDQEREADAFGLKLMESAGFDPNQAGAVWQQLIEERKAEYAARGRKVPKSGGLLDSHPADGERMRDLTMSGKEVYRPDITYKTGKDGYRAALGDLRWKFLADQVKMNNPGASLYLIESLAQDGWNGQLRYYQGEVYRMRGDAGDGEQALTAYAKSQVYSDAPPEVYRASGYAQIKAGQSDSGKIALRKYLDLSPGAMDRAMVELNLQ